MGVRHLNEAKSYCIRTNAVGKISTLPTGLTEVPACQQRSEMYAIVFRCGQAASCSAIAEDMTPDSEVHACDYSDGCDYRCYRVSVVEDALIFYV